MSTPLFPWRSCCLLVTLLLAATAACRKEQPPGGAAAPPATEPPAVADDQVQVILAKADLVDGSADQVISKCPNCALAMDGSPDHALEVSGYTLHFCSAECKETFAADTTASILAMKLPEE